MRISITVVALVTAFSFAEAPKVLRGLLVL